MAIKSEDLIKYITEQVVTYIETPADIRKEQRKSMQASKETWSSRWFGMVPIAISIWMKERKDRKAQKKDTPTG